MKKIAFLTLAEVVEIHSDQIQHYGGSERIRDMNLLSSAIACHMPHFRGDFSTLIYTKWQQPMPFISARITHLLMVTREQPLHQR